MDLLLLEKALLGLFAAVTLGIVVSKLRGKHLKLPPGPLPVPVFGNWLQVGDDLNHRNLTALAKRFGDILLLRMGVRNLVVVSSPTLAREVLHAQGVEFGSRTRNVVFDIFTGKGQDMVFTVYGDHWRKMRRIMTVPFFTNKVVQQNREGWEEEARQVVEDVKRDPQAATDGVVLRRRLQLMMYNNMYRIMFNHRFQGMDDPLFNKLRAANGERSRLAQSFEYNYGDFIPVLRPFLRGYLKKCQDLKVNRLKLFDDHFVAEKKKKMDELGSTMELKCAIDHILDAERRGEINYDNVLYIVENINVAGTSHTHTHTHTLSLSLSLSLALEMPFKRYVEIGRVALVTYGKEYGRLVVIVDVIDQNRALVDSPDMVRGQINFKRLSLTDIKIDIPRVPKKKTLLDAMEAADVKNKWENSSWGRKLIVQKRRASLNDFDRFKVMLAKIKRGGAIRQELAKLKKADVA